MDLNAFVVDWTIHDYEQFQSRLREAGYVYEQDENTRCLRVKVSILRIDDFALLCQSYLNAPQNYVDVQYPQEKMTVLIFPYEVFKIEDGAENERVKAWAITQGLPPAQAEWATSFA